MLERFLRIIKAMDLEERVFHVGALLALLGLFLPWLTSAAYGEVQTWANGFGFRTGYIGHAVFLITAFLISITLSPLLRGPVLVRKSHRHIVRLMLTACILLLLLTAFTVLLRVTFEVSGIEVRFGIYIALVGSALSTLYSFLIYQDTENAKVRELFHHPDEPQVPRPRTEPDQEFLPPPPPPPPPAPPPPEDHHLFSKSL